MSEHVVIGAGLVGAATAWRLASSGENVTIVERKTPHNDEGSSHGSARIFRYAYPDQFYTGLAITARELWSDLEHGGRSTLITPTGALDHGELRTPIQLAEVLAKIGIEHDLMSADSALRRWPQLNFEGPVLWHPDAGVIDAAAAVDEMLRIAVESGSARLLTHWEATKVEKTRHGYRVHSATGEHLEGANIIIAAGGWLPSLLSECGLPAAFVQSFPQLEVRQEQAFHLPYRGQSSDQPLPTTWPTFIHKTRNREIYGLPGGRDAGGRGQKVAEFNGGRVLSSATEQDGTVSARNRNMIIDYATEFMPGVSPEPYAETTCLFTNTPTQDFLIERCDGVVVVSACSGHGGKFAPILGEMTSDLVVGRDTVPRRFRLTPHH